MSLATLSTLARAAELAAARDTKAAVKIRQHLALLAPAPESRHDLIVASLAVVYPSVYAPLLGRAVGRDRRIGEAVDTGAPYPGAPLSLRARLVLGESPAAVSGGLTRAEAHRWLTDAPTRPPSEWLLGQRGLQDQAVRDVAVARWLIACWADPQRRSALTREREERGPHGERVHGSYLSRVDELRKADLRPSVEATYRSCGARLMRAVERSMASRGKPLAATPRWWVPIRCARLLLSAADLAAEGSALGHCVAQYVTYVRSGDSVVVGLSVCGHRSTVEIGRKTRAVRQHCGPRNSRPHPLCQRALAVVLRRISQNTEEGEK